MSKWKKVLNEEVSQEHEASVLKAVGPLLSQNAEIAAKDATKSRRWTFVLPALALGAAAIAILPFVGNREPALGPKEVGVSVALDLAMNYDMYRDLREIEKLEILEQLGDYDQWPSKKAKPEKI